MEREPPSRRHVLRSVLASGVLVVLAGRAVASSSSQDDAEAQRAHAAGGCGSMGPGSGLRDGRGWVVSMMPGRHEFRMNGGGDVYLTAARFRSAMDFDVGRPYYIVIEGAASGAVLEWRYRGKDWSPVSKYFLYPPS